MPILPPQYGAASPYQLLREAELGKVAFDHRLIRSLIDRPDETIPALKRFASEYRETKLLDLDEQVFDLFRHLRTPEAIPFYIHLMHKHEDGIPDEIVEAFAELGSPAVEPLLSRYRQLGPEDGADLPFLMAALGVRDPRILEVLIETLDRDVYEGGICLGLYGDAAARAAVEAALDRAESSEERKALEDCLEQIGGDSANPEQEPYSLWDEYPETALPEIDLLPREDRLAFLDCADPEYRKEAALSLCGESYSAAARARLLDRARNDEAAGVRAACLEALGSSLEDRAVLKFLLDTLQDSTKLNEERAGALIALAPQSRRPEVDRAIRTFYENPETRPAAISAITLSHDPRYKPLVLEALALDDFETHRRAIRACGALGIAEACGHVRSQFDNEGLRVDALLAYAMAAPVRNTSKAIEQLFADIENLAGGFSLDEEELVGRTLDLRLETAGLPPLFFPEDDDQDGHDHSHGEHTHH